MKIDTFIHDFKTDLLWSEAPAQYIPYMQAISHWWKDAVSWDRIENIEQQKKGKDITIVTQDGRSINIQFKSRTKCYTDCAIEYRHDLNNGLNKPGWIEVPSEADYLLYLIPKGKPYGSINFVPQSIYKIDYPSLHTAWDLNKDTWLQKDKFFHPDARNMNYWTRNVAIPWNVLETAGVKIEVLEIE